MKISDASRALHKEMETLQTAYESLPADDEAGRAALGARMKDVALKSIDAGMKSGDRTEVLLSVIAKHMRAMHDAMMEKVDRKIEKRLADAMFFKGVYQPGGEYGPGSLVQAKGTVWLAEKGATGKPGEADSGWRMLVKTGGRDAAE